MVQRAIPEILESTPASFYEQSNNYLETNATIAASALEGIPGVTYVKPQGAMYMMIGFDMSMFTDFTHDISLSEMLIAEESVVCLPGSVNTNLSFWFYIYLDIWNAQLFKDRLLWASR